MPGSQSPTHNVEANSAVQECMLPISSLAVPSTQPLFSTATELASAPTRVPFPFSQCASEERSYSTERGQSVDHSQGAEQTADGTLTAASSDEGSSLHATPSHSGSSSQEGSGPKMPPSSTACGTDTCHQSPCEHVQEIPERVPPPNDAEGAGSQPPSINDAGRPSVASSDQLSDAVATKFCGICREVLPVTEFAPNRGTYNTYCRICNQIRMKRKKWSVKALGDALAAGVISKTDITDPEPMAACPHGSVHGIQGRRCYLCSVVKPIAKFPLFDCSQRRSLCCSDCDTSLRVAATHSLAEVRKSAVDGYLYRYSRTEPAQLTAGCATLECVSCGCLRPEGELREEEGGRACWGCRLMAASCGVHLLDVKRAAASGAVLLGHLGGAVPPTNATPEVRFA
jgi:hypothetical protein